MQLQQQEHRAAAEESPITSLKEKYGILGTKVPYLSYLAACDLHLRPLLAPSAKRTFLIEHHPPRGKARLRPTMVWRKLRPTILNPLYWTTVLRYATLATKMSKLSHICIVIITKLSYYYSYVNAKTNPELWAKHKSQLSPQSRNRHGNVQKNVIPNTLGVTQIITYCQNRLVNRKMSIAVKLILHVRIK
jgi:hypothetical protein